MLRFNCLKENSRRLVSFSEHFTSRDRGGRHCTSTIQVPAPVRAKFVSSSPVTNLNRLRREDSSSSLGSARGRRPILVPLASYSCLQHNSARTHTRLSFSLLSSWQQRRGSTSASAAAAQLFYACKQPVRHARVTPCIIPNFQRSGSRVYTPGACRLGQPPYTEKQLAACEPWPSAPLPPKKWSAVSISCLEKKKNETVTV